MCYNSSGALAVPCSTEVEKQLVCPSHVRRHNDPMDLVNLAQEVMKADQTLQACTQSKLEVVVAQIRSLQVMVIVMVVVVVVVVIVVVNMEGGNCNLMI